MENKEWVILATTRNGEGVTVHQKAWYSTTAIRFAEAKFVGGFKSAICLKKSEWENLNAK